MEQQELIGRGLALGRGNTVLIGDRWEPGDSDVELTSLNPATGAVLATARAASTEQAARAARSSREALESSPWRGVSPRQRSRLLDAFADALEKHREELEALVVTELGSPITTAKGMQVSSPIDRFRFYADLARRGPAGGWERLLSFDGPSAKSVSVLLWQPAGVVAAITAFNLPLGIASLKVAAALAAGCTVVLSPSPRTFLSTTAFVRLACEAGLPPGVLNLVTGEVESNKELTTNREVDVVSFTGSEAVGRQIQAQASGTLKRVVLELGGKSPSVLLPGARLEDALQGSVLRFTRNAGQACGATTRILVPAEAYDEAAEHCAKVVDSLSVGDPWDPATSVGPLIRADQRTRVEDTVQRALDQGAEIVAGGGRPPIEEGFYVNPTVLGSLGNDAEISQKEVFGPVAVLLPYVDVEDALAIANASDFGLNAGVWGPTADALAFARRLRSGTVALNGGGPSRPDMPWGGFGHSGIGRDGGEEGLREYLEVQHVHWPL
jgi:aldehyde dehydrogenase (NAD+)/betaine-aldehyde dehydrogenase